MKKTNLSVSKSWLPLVAALILGSCTSYDGEWEKDDPTPDNSFSFSNYKLGEGMVRSNVTSPNLPNVPGGESSTSKMAYRGLRLPVPLIISRARLTTSS